VLNSGGASPSHGCETANDAKEQLGMSQADQALIVIHRGDSWFGRLRCHRVTIDGWLARYTARASPTTEFSVEARAHTLEVAIDWTHSQPSRLELSPGSRTDVRIAQRPGVTAWGRSRVPAFLAMGTV
jgi:hypothetical protein